MNFSPDIYQIDNANKYRFALGISGDNPLVVVGLNPSTADDKIPDQTIKKIVGFASRNQYDGFIMLNLYPLRCTKPENLPDQHDIKAFKKNLDVIEHQLFKLRGRTILAAWGQDIQLRKYLQQSLSEIYKIGSNLNVDWVKIGDLTKKGFPRHPSRAAYSQGITTFEFSRNESSYNQQS